MNTLEAELQRERDELFGAGQTLRSVVRRIRENARMSHRTVDKRLGFPSGSCRRFEGLDTPLTELDRERLVSFLKFLLACRQDYPAEMVAFRKAYGLSIKKAAKLANIAHASWEFLENSTHLNWPHEKVRSRVDALLSTPHDVLTKRVAKLFRAA